MTDLLHDILLHLNTSKLRENLTPMFCQALHWGKPRGTPRPFAVGAPVSRTLTAHPVAQLGGLPVLRVNWPAGRLPTITQRRKRIEQFLREIGTSPAESSSRNPLEQPWLLKPDDFARRVKRIDPKGLPDPWGLYAATRDETAALTEQIVKVEREIDERVAGLYEVSLLP